MSRTQANRISFVLLTMALVIAGGKPARAKSEQPPLTDPAWIEAGRQRFDQACTYCHGKEGAGGKVKSFKGRTDLDPRMVFETIANGRKRGANIMPPWKSSLSETQIWELTAYILSLGNAPAQ